MATKFEGTFDCSLQSNVEHFCAQVFAPDGSSVAVIEMMTDRDDANRLAELFAEAGTVTHETGLTPRQLAEQNQDLMRRILAHEETARGFAPSFDELRRRRVEVNELGEQRDELLAALQAYQAAEAMPMQAHRATVAAIDEFEKREEALRAARSMGTAAIAKALGHERSGQ